MATSEKNSTFGVALVLFLSGGALALPAFIGTGYHVLLGYQYNQRFEVHLDRAVHATDVKLASQELEIAKKWLEETKKTSGNSSVTIDIAQNDLGYFYQNISEATQRLNALSAEPNSVAASNELLKFEGSFKVKTEKGETLRQPENLEIFPNQRIWFYGGGVLWVLALIGAFLSWAGIVGIGES